MKRTTCPIGIRKSGFCTIVRERREKLPRLGKVLRNSYYGQVLEGKDALESIILIGVLFA